MSDSNPSTNQIVAQLRNGDRDPIADADEVRAVDGIETVEAIHEAYHGRIVVQFSYRTAYERNDERTFEFDLIGGDDQ